MPALICYIMTTTRSPGVTEQEIEDAITAFLLQSFSVKYL